MEKKNKKKKRVFGKLLRTVVPILSIITIVLSVFAVPAGAVTANGGVAEYYDVDRTNTWGDGHGELSLNAITPFIKNSVPFNVVYYDNIALNSGYGGATSGTNYSAVYSPSASINGYVQFRGSSSDVGTWTVNPCFTPNSYVFADIPEQLGNSEMYSDIMRPAFISYVFEEMKYLSANDKIYGGLAIDFTETVRTPFDNLPFGMTMHSDGFYWNTAFNERYSKNLSSSDWVHFGLGGILLPIPSGTAGAEFHASGAKYKITYDYYLPDGSKGSYVGNGAVYGINGLNYIRMPLIPPDSFLKDNVGSVYISNLYITYVFNASFTLTVPANAQIVYSYPCFAMDNGENLSSFEQQFATSCRYGYSDFMASLYNDTVDKKLGDLRNIIDNVGGAVNVDFTTWIGTAVSGFLDFTLFGDVTIGGMLAVVVAVAFVVLFLKFFAGG